MEDVATTDGYGEFVKLRERFQDDGMDEETAQQAVRTVLVWAAEMASHATRGYKPMAEMLVRELEREELPISPPKGDAVTYADVAPQMQPKRRIKPPTSAPVSF